jgi:hypothetical protein
MQIPVTDILRRLAILGLSTGLAGCDPLPPAAVELADAALVIIEPPDAGPDPVYEPVDAGAPLDAGLDGSADGGFDACVVSICYPGKPPGGRRPAGLVEGVATVCDDPLGSFFAASARLEAASVPAFQALARELRAHGAPGTLVRRARRSACEERVHFALASRLAARYGARAARPIVERLPVRSLEAVALENAVEGCVNETWSAVVTLRQAFAARDRVVAQVARAIAEDELRHARLSWAVDRWARSRLGPSSRRRLDEARAAAAADISRDLARHPPPSALVQAAVIPAQDSANDMLTALGAQLWATGSRG